MNTVGRAAGQVRAEARLCSGLEEHLDAHRADVADLRLAQLHTHLRRFALTRPELRFGTVPAPGPALWWRAREWAHRLTVPAGLVALSPALLAGLPLAAVVRRLHELRDVPGRVRPDPDAVERLRSAENAVAHNPFTAANIQPCGSFSLMA